MYFDIVAATFRLSVQRGAYRPTPEGVERLLFDAELLGESVFTEDFGTLSKLVGLAKAISWNMDEVHRNEVVSRLLDVYGREKGIKPEGKQNILCLAVALRGMLRKLAITIVGNGISSETDDALGKLALDLLLKLKDPIPTPHY